MRDLFFIVGLLTCYFSFFSSMLFNTTEMFGVIGLLVGFLMFVFGLGGKTDPHDYSPY